MPMIQLKWSDEEVWRDLEETTAVAAPGKIRNMELIDRATMIKYPHHRFHAEFRVKEDT